jgi:protoheme IX farnesyltransferase
MWKLYSDLTKFGIVIFVVLSGLAGFATSFEVEHVFDLMRILSLAGGLYFLSSGSLALNQVQEWKLDQGMKRTASRPIAAGKLKPVAGGILAFTYIFLGLNLLFEISGSSALLGAITIILYNGVYTYIWKRRWVFGAVPGAIPGALPVTIGYMANPGANIFSLESIYLFLIMFFWQMPHFWALAIRYRDDYASVNIPTAPVTLGVERTIYHIGIYTFAYVITAMASPWFVHASWIYIALVGPFCFKVLQEYFRFFRSKGERRWLAFFMWTNISMLVFLVVPVLDKWNFLVIGKN